jgi:hypothetical protein
MKRPTFALLATAAALSVSVFGQTNISDLVPTSTATLTGLSSRSLQPTVNVQLSNKTLTELTDEPIVRWDTVIASFLGAGLAALVGVILARGEHSAQKRRDVDLAKKAEETEGSFEQNILAAVRQDIVFMASVYSMAIGKNCWRPLPKNHF